jgi:PPOX class probable F420-dependent enzyme
MSETIPPEARRLLDEPNFAYVATVMPDGSPQTTPVWVERDGDTVVFNTAKGRAKANNLSRDPRVAVTVHDPDHPYVYLQIRGRAELVEDGAREHIDKLSRKYLGHDYRGMRPGMERLIVRVIPERIYFRTED